MSIECEAAATSSHVCCGLFRKLCSHQQSVSELVFVLSLAVCRNRRRLQQARAVFVSENRQTENTPPPNFIHFHKDLQTKSETQTLFGEAPPLKSLLTYSWAVSYFLTSQRWFETHCNKKTQEFLCVVLLEKILKSIYNISFSFFISSNRGWR